MSDEIKKGGEAEVDLSPEQINSVQDENLRGTITATAAQKKHWREKAMKAEERIKELEALVPQPKAAPKAKEAEGDMESRVMERVSIFRKYPDLNDEHLKEADAFAKAKGISLSEAVAAPFFQSYVKSVRDAEAAEQAKGNPSNRTGQPGSYSIDDLSDPVKVKSMPRDVFQNLARQAGIKI